MKKSTPMQLSHGSDLNNPSLIHAFFQRLAETALDKSLSRAADLSYFKQVKRRIESGEDLTKELPQLKKLDKKTALATIKTLIKRCDSDLTDYWSIPSSPKIRVNIQHRSFKAELVPRFKAVYTFKTVLGSVTINALTMGRYIFVSADTTDIKKANAELALREVEKQLMIVTLSL